MEQMWSRCEDKAAVALLDHKVSLKYSYLLTWQKRSSDMFWPGAHELLI